MRIVGVLKAGELLSLALQSTSGRAPSRREHEVAGEETVQAAQYFYGLIWQRHDMQASVFHAVGREFPIAFIKVEFRRTHPCDFAPALPSDLQRRAQACRRMEQHEPRTDQNRRGIIEYRVFSAGHGGLSI